ncbi:MEF2BNB-like protein [Quillaja saponaria]|uniref:MEF2BNB-like protein n=1 Tax=Quillaja saponaria TaxID=32244 RepID=A0AAD7PWJ9_QUISA|nr:MEF2BNB-like protein [Quillaja saponaria]
MHGFSTVDGFVEITECLAEMIKFVANEPSVGLFYIQQHTQKAVPNVIHLKNSVVGKCHETTLHTEDLEDSISMVRSMKESGFPIADEMIRDIKKSMVIMSTKQPRRGLINYPNSNLQTGRTSSSFSFDAQEGSRRSANYFSTVLKSAKQKASTLKWPPLDSRQSVDSKYDKFKSQPNPLLSAPSASSSSSLQDTEVDELPLSSQVEDQSQEHEEEPDVSILSDKLLLVSEKLYDNFKADKEAQLEEWLEGTSK